jgi:hypothetical protein
MTMLYNIAELFKNHFSTATEIKFKKLKMRCHCADCKLQLFIFTFMNFTSLIMFKISISGLYCIFNSFFCLF